MRKLLALTAAVLTCASLATPLAAADDILICGATTKSSIKLDRHLLNCSGDGIVIGADDITIDLNGYTLGGDRANGGVGVLNAGGFEDIEITGGTIGGFDRGIEVSGGATHNEISHILADDNRLAGVYLQADSSSVERSAFTDNSEEIVIIGDGNTVERVVVTNSSSNSGVSVDVTGDGNVVEGVHITGGGVGIAVDGDANVVERNEVERVGVNAITVLGDSNLIKSNDVFRSDEYGVWVQRAGGVGAGNVIEHNYSDDNGRDGYLIDSIESEVIRNSAIDNDDDGFQIRGAHVVIERNYAEGNGFKSGDGYGILASAVGAQGKRNEVTGNKRGCTPEELCGEGRSSSSASASCHASYPDFCIPPPPPDLNCADVSSKNFTVVHTVSDPDPHGFDTDKDGKGCE